MVPLQAVDQPTALVLVAPPQALMVVLSLAVDLVQTMVLAASRKVGKAGPAVAVSLVRVALPAEAADTDGPSDFETPSGIETLAEIAGKAVVLARPFPFAMAAVSLGIEAAPEADLQRTDFS